MQHDALRVYGNKGAEVTLTRRAEAQPLLDALPAPKRTRETFIVQMNARDEIDRRVAAAGLDEQFMELFAGDDVGTYQDFYRRLKR